MLAVGILVMILVSVNLSSIAMNTEKTISATSEDFNNLLTQVKTNKGSSRGWIEEQKLLASDGEDWDWFAHSVSISGDYALVGADRDEDMGSAYVFKYDGVSWIEEQKLIASDGEVDDVFGWSVSLDGDYAIIGAPGNDVGGSAYVFKYNGTSWIEEQKLIASDSELLDHFARSVSINNNKALIGARGNDENKGSAYVFKYNGTSWIEEQKLIASDGEEGDFFGWSVSIDGDNALIGAPKDDDTHIDSGAAYVFKYNGTCWNQEQKLTASDSEEIDNFGLSVSINNNKALIGAPFDDDNGIESGSAYVFKYDGASWNEEQKLTALYGSDYDWFGLSVSIYNEKALIGVPCDNDNGFEAGSAYVFNYNGASWNEEQKLTASDGTPYDNFGWFVSINSNKALIGAPLYYNAKGKAYVFVFENLTIPDLYCNGNVNWNDVTPGETVVDIFTVQNIGGPDTLLNWEIQSFPDWGDWTFTPGSGTGLNPEDGYFEIEVSIVAPDELNENFYGEITIVNSDDPSDTCNIDVSLATPVNQHSYSFPLLQRLLERFPNAFPLLRHLLDM